MYRRCCCGCDAVFFDPLPRPPFFLVEVDDVDGNGGGAVYGGGGFGCICCIIICILCCRGSQNQGDGYQENGGQVTETVVVETYNVAPNQGYGGQPNQYPPNQGYGGQP